MTDIKYNTSVMTYYVTILNIIQKKSRTIKLVRHTNTIILSIIVSIEYPYKACGHYSYSEAYGQYNKYYNYSYIFKEPIQFLSLL